MVSPPPMIRVFEANFFRHRGREAQQIGMERTWATAAAGLSLGFDAVAPHVNKSQSDPTDGIRRVPAVRTLFPADGFRLVERETGMFDLESST